MPKFDTNDDSVVVIVGSGAGGGTLANELCQRGVSVVLLEAGKRQSPATFINDEWTSFGQLAWLDKRTTSGSWRVARDFPGLPAWICKTVGGSTVHWAGASLRIQPHEFKARTTYGDIAGASLLDWPLDYEELAPYYAKAEDKLGVTRTNDIPGLPGNNNFKVFYNGATKVGYKASTGRMAINSRPRKDRASCLQLGFCFQGCKSGAKWSALYTEVAAAEATGKLDLRTESHAAKIEHDAAGKAVGVVYFDAAGKQQRQKARAVCVAGNSIETPRLLLLSASSKYPDGLANSSGQVGRNYQRHTTGSVYAIMDEPVHMYRGTTMAGIIQDEIGFDPSRGFAGGYELETLSLGLPFMAAFLNPGEWGRVVRAVDGSLREHGGNVDRRRGHAATDQSGDIECHREGSVWPVRAQRALRRSSERCRHAQPRLRAGSSGVRSSRCTQSVLHATLSFHAQPRYLPDECECAGWRVQQVRTDARHQEPVHQRWKPVHDRRR